MNIHLHAHTHPEEIHTHVNPLSILGARGPRTQNGWHSWFSHPLQRNIKKILQTKPFKLCLTLLSLRKEMAILRGKKQDASTFLWRNILRDDNLTLVAFSWMIVNFSQQKNEKVCVAVVFTAAIIIIFIFFPRQKEKSKICRYWCWCS